jgi:hypothetical protein
MSPCEVVAIPYLASFRGHLFYACHPERNRGPRRAGFLARVGWEAKDLLFNLHHPSHLVILSEAKDLLLSNGRGFSRAADVLPTCHSEPSGAALAR